MEQLSYGQFIGSHLKTMKRLTKNDQCLVTECISPPIHSHVIAEAVLERIAEKGFVLTWNPSDAKIAKNAQLGLEQALVYQQPIRVGIRNDVTYPLFCRQHDGPFFRKLEYPSLSSQIGLEEVTLLAYRALCYKTWNAYWDKKLNYMLSSKDPKVARQHKRLFAREIMIEARERLKGIIDTKDYQQIDCKVIPLNLSPCIACTDAYIPYIDNNEGLYTAKGTLSPKAEDIVTFSIFPDSHPDKSFCVLTWFRSSQRVSKFIEYQHLNQLSNDEIINKLFFAATRSSLVYVSPTWWNAQSIEARAQFSNEQIADALAAQRLLQAINENTAEVVEGKE